MSGNTLAGGQESGDDKITFRLPTHLKEQYKDEVDTMSGDLKAYVRQRVNDDATEYETPLKPPTTPQLAHGYKQLCQVARIRGSATVREPTARRACSGGPQSIAKPEVVDLVLDPLQSRGYLRRVSNIYGQTGWRINQWHRVED